MCMYSSPACWFGSKAVAPPGNSIAPLNHSRPQPKPAREKTPSPPQPKAYLNDDSSVKPTPPPNQRGSAFPTKSRLLRQLNKRHRLNSRDIEPFPAANILASHHIVPPHHVALCLGKASPIAVISPARQLRLLPPHQPAQLILSLLATVRTRHYMHPLLCLLIEKIALFHPAPHRSRTNRTPLPSAILHHMSRDEQE